MQKTINIKNSTLPWWKVLDVDVFSANTYTITRAYLKALSAADTPEEKAEINRALKEWANAKDLSF